MLHMTPRSPDAHVERWAIVTEQEVDRGAARCRHTARIAPATGRRKLSEIGVSLRLLVLRTFAFRAWRSSGFANVTVVCNVTQMRAQPTVAVKALSECADAARDLRATQQGGLRVGVEGGLRPKNRWFSSFRIR